MAKQALQSVGMTPEEIDALTPLAVMRLVMTIWLKAGNLQGALEAAQAAAPYLHPKLTSSDVRIEDGRKLDAMSDEQLQHESTNWKVCGSPR